MFMSVSESDTLKLIYKNKYNNETIIRREEYIMAGYRNFSMSNNAVSAYESGERPFSKWTKKDILEEISQMTAEEELSLNCDFEQLKKVPAQPLKELCLSYSSWHHTSSHFNKTDFYSIDADKIGNLTNERIAAEIAKWKKQNSQKPIEVKWKCAFLEWGGTRKHPKPKEIIEIGTVKGDYFYREDGSKKKTTANGFRFIEKVR